VARCANSPISVSYGGLFTIGHSTRTFEEFADLLHEHHVDHVFDVRKLAGSNRYPQFNADSLAPALGERNIAYSRVEPLTGRRTVSKTVAFETNAWWQNRSFHNYADYAYSSADFAAALAELANAAKKERIAVMCSEAVWWRCHRRIIADYLLTSGVEVTHILGAHQANAAELSAGAQPLDDGRLTYPPAGSDVSL